MRKYNNKLVVVLEEPSFLGTTLLKVGTKGNPSFYG